MATESDDHVVHETVIERESRGSGAGSMIIGVAVLALVVIIAFFLLARNHNDALRTNAVTSAASSVAGAAGNLGKAAGNAADPAK